jgi:hypothetical protein
MGTNNRIEQPYTELPKKIPSPDPRARATLSVGALRTALPTKKQAVNQVRQDPVQRPEGALPHPYVLCSNTAKRCIASSSGFFEIFWTSQPI